MNNIHEYITCNNSNIHGKGIFATRYIPSGTIITKYCPNLDLVELSDVPHNCLDYIMVSPDNNNLVVYGNPEDTLNLNSCGYMINDKYSIIFNRGSNLQENEMKINIYNNLPELTIAFCDTSYNMMTTRNVNINEELTFKYGIHYWLKWNIRNTNSCFIKFMALYLLDRYGYLSINNIGYEHAINICGLTRTGGFMTNFGLNNHSSMEQWNWLKERALRGDR